MGFLGFQMVTLQAYDVCWNSVMRFTNEVVERKKDNELLSNVRRDSIVSIRNAYYFSTVGGKLFYRGGIG